MPFETRRILGTIAIAAASVLLSFSESRAAAQSARVVKIQIDSATIVGEISEDFVGLGYETSAVAQPDFFSAKNTRLIKLYHNLGPRGLIRIGGNVSDHTRFIPNGTPLAKTERGVTVINRASLTDLGDFARATGWKVMWGLNLGTGNREEAVQEAVAVNAALGSSLHSFEIGNEVDLMRKYSKDYDAYHAAYIEYKAAIRARLPRANFSGPDVAGNMRFVEKFVAAESGGMRLATHHYYRGGAHDPKSTMQRLLSRDDAFDTRLEQLHTLCAAHHIDYRINEVNSFFGGGKEGVSDRFGSALWCLDYMFDLASHGCSGVNMETDINQLGFISFYSPIVHDAAGVCSARPEYYGMLAFAMAGRGNLLKTSIEKDDIDLTAYATKDGRGTIYLTVINKDLTCDAAIECRLPEGYRSAEAYRLRCPSIDAKSGVTFGGAAVASDGGWIPAVPESVNITAGIVDPIITHCSSVVMKFRKE